MIPCFQSMQNRLQRWLGSKRSRERADGRTEEKTDLTFTCFITPENLNDALEGLKSLAKKLSQPVGLFIYIGSACTEDQLFHLKKTLQSYEKSQLKWKLIPFGKEKEALEHAWGEGFQKIVDLDEDEEAREEYEGILNEDVLFKPLSLCCLPNVPHYALFDPVCIFKRDPVPLYREFVASDRIAQGVTPSEDLIAWPEIEDDDFLDSEDLSPWEGVVFVNRAKLVSLFPMIQDDLSHRSESSHPEVKSGDKVDQKQKAVLAKQLKLAKISNDILASWQLNPKASLHDQVYAFLKAVTKGSIRWHSLLFPALFPQNFATVESTDEFFEALANLNQPQRRGR